MLVVENMEYALKAEILIRTAQGTYQPFRLGLFSYVSSIHFNKVYVVKIDIFVLSLLFFEVAILCNFPNLLQQVLKACPGSTLFCSIPRILTRFYSLVGRIP